jgi:hypothetical protein
LLPRPLQQLQPSVQWYESPTISHRRQPKAGQHHCPAFLITHQQLVSPTSNLHA